MRSGFLFVVCCGGLAAQQASIEGTTVNAITHEPLSGVHVRLVALTFNGINAAYGAISDRTGHFSIGIIRPGTYIPVPEHSGFLYVHMKTSEAALPNLAIKPGEHRTDWVVEMMPRAVLSGRVLDENGDPVQGVQVRAVDVAPDKAPMVLIPLPSIGTDDRGEFRIVGAPGKFYLQASPSPLPSNDRPEVRSDGSSEPVYGATFYPSSLVKDRGAVVEAIAGKDVGGLEIHLQRQRAGGGTITGTVSGIPDMGDGVRAQVIMQYGDTAQTITNSRSTMVGSDGKFSFPAGQPGFYRLYATSSRGKTQMASRGVELHIEGSDPPAVDLPLIPAIELAGTLAIEGDAPGKPREKLGVRLEQTGPGGGWSSRQSGGEVDRDGAFRIEGVAPAKFRVRVDTLPENAYIKSVDVDGAVAADATVDFSTARPSRIKVTINRNGGQLTGTVLDEKGERMLTPLAMVLLVQDPKEIQNLEQDSTQRVTPESKYTFKAVRPGKYRIFAVDVLRISGNDTMELLKKLAERGEEIEIKEGDRITKDLRVLPKEAANAR